MALLDTRFFSDTLGLSTAMTVLMPEHDPPPAGHRVLFLLHGLSDDHTMWLRRSSIERYAAAHDQALVMPDVHRSFYADTAWGHGYWTFVSQELPAVVRRLFHVSDRREDRFVAGLSMGGYGAFKLALAQPDRFAAAASLSGALDRFDPEHAGQSPYLPELNRIFGDVAQVPGTDDDLRHLATTAHAGAHALPRLYACCGTADFLLEQNRDFRDHCARLGVPLAYAEHADADHTWDYWDAQIAPALDWMLQDGPSG